MVGTWSLLFGRTHYSSEPGPKQATSWAEEAFISTLHVYLFAGSPNDSSYTAWLLEEVESKDDTKKTMN